MRNEPRNRPPKREAKGRRWLERLLPVAMALAISQSSFAAEIAATALGSSGGNSAAGGYQLGSTVGLAVVGASSTSSFEHLAGFWRWAPDPATSGTEFDDEVGLPLHTSLTGAVPNPFRGSTEVRFDVAGAHPVRSQLYVFDVAGRMVARLVDDDLAPGSYHFSWNGRSRHGDALAAGVYFARFVSGDYSATRRLVLRR